MIDDIENIKEKFKLINKKAKLKLKVFELMNQPLNNFDDLLKIFYLGIEYLSIGTEVLNKFNINIKQHAELRKSAQIISYILLFTAGDGGKIILNNSAIKFIEKNKDIFKLLFFSSSIKNIKENEQLYSSIIRKQSLNKNNKFEKDLNKEKEIFYKHVKPHIESKGWIVSDFLENLYYQFLGIDFIIKNPNTGEIKTCDLKVRKYDKGFFHPQKGKSIFIELIQNKSGIDPFEYKYTNLQFHYFDFPVEYSDHKKIYFNNNTSMLIINHDNLKVFRDLYRYLTKSEKLILKEEGILKETKNSCTLGFVLFTGQQEFKNIQQKILSITDTDIGNSIDKYLYKL